MITETFASKSSSAVHTANYDPQTGASDCSCSGWRFQRAGKERGCTHTKQMWAKHAQTCTIEEPVLSLSARIAANVARLTTINNADALDAGLAIVAKQAAQLVSAFGTQASLLGDEYVAAQPVVAAPTVVGFKPMLAIAMTAGRVIEDYCTDAYVMQLKVDGHRVVVRKTGDVVLVSSDREGVRPATTVTPAIMADLKKLPDGIFDGEINVPGGMSSDVTRIDLIAQRRLALFDVMALNGRDLTGESFDSRNAHLVGVVTGLDLSSVYVLPVVPVSKATVEAWWAEGAEGAIIKRRAGTYTQALRSPEWIKVKKCGASVCTVTGFKAGKLGAYSMTTLIEDATQNVLSVKTLNNDELRAIAAAGPDAYIGTKLVVSFIERFPLTKAMRHPMFDHWASPEEVNGGDLNVAWCYTE